MHSNLTGKRPTRSTMRLPDRRARSLVNSRSGQRSSRCGRRGCNRPLANCMECSQCKSWFHENCTGLSASQYLLLSGPQYEFKCMKCISSTYPSVHLSLQKGVLPTPISPLGSILPASPNHQTVADPSHPVYPAPVPTVNRPNPDLSMPDDSLSSSAIRVLLNTILDAVSSQKTATHDLSDGMATLTHRVAMLETACTALPASKMLQKTGELSRHYIEHAASVEADAAIRSKNVIVRGLPFSFTDPMETAVEFLLPLASIHPHLKVTNASWFFREDPTISRPLLISFASAAQRSALLQSRRILLAANAGISVMPDLPFSKRSNPKSPLPDAVTIPLEPVNPQDTMILDSSVSRPSISSERDVASPSIPDSSNPKETPDRSSPTPIPLDAEDGISATPITKPVGHQDEMKFDYSVPGLSFGKDASALSTTDYSSAEETLDGRLESLDPTNATLTAPNMSNQQVHTPGLPSTSTTAATIPPIPTTSSNKEIRTKDIRTQPPAQHGHRLTPRGGNKQTKKYSTVPKNYRASYRNPPPLKLKTPPPGIKPMGYPPSLMTIRTSPMQQAFPVHPPFQGAFPHRANAQLSYPSPYHIPYQAYPTQLFPPAFHPLFLTHHNVHYPHPFLTYPPNLS